MTKLVTCRPYPEDPEIQETMHRAVCLHRPYPGCSYCPHSIFTAFFNNVSQRYNLVKCPRWASNQDLLDGKGPDNYFLIEIATCERRPFTFCSSCPSIEKLRNMGADKTKDEWFGRWSRFEKEILNEQRSFNSL